MGARLLDFAIDKAKESGVRYLRLETGDDATMAKAQDVYESHGLQVYETRNWVFYLYIRRQLELTEKRRLSGANKGIERTAQGRINPHGMGRRSCPTRYAYDQAS